MAGDAMFTKDFVCLAMGYQALGDAAKAKEMLGQGADFAMEAARKGCRRHGPVAGAGDAAAATKALTGALEGSLHHRRTLRSLAVVAELNDATLFGQIFDKIKTKAAAPPTSRAWPRMPPIWAVTRPPRPSKSSTKAPAKYGSPADLIALSGAMGEIDPAAAGALYDKALDSAKDFTALMQVLAAAAGNAEFTKAVLAKAGATGQRFDRRTDQLADAYADLGDSHRRDRHADQGRRRRRQPGRDAQGGRGRGDKHRRRYRPRRAGQDKLVKREANQAKYIEIAERRRQVHHRQAVHRPGRPHHGRGGRRRLRRQGARPGRRPHARRRRLSTSPASSP
jgi:hypothetical protein